MTWGGPERTGLPFPSLGWALIDTWYREFPSPRDERKPFELTDEQAMTVLRWYEVHPLTGEFVYRRGMTRKSKKTGKSPLLAAMCIAELAMDVRFDGWDADGNPTGRPWGTGGDDPPPWVQIAALSEDQDENTYAPLYTFLTANDGRLAELLDIDAGLTRCFLARREGRIEPVTSAAGSREGQPITFGCLDETGLMTLSNGGVKLARTVRRNASGMGGRVYETTNGYVPGEGSVAEGTEKAHAAGRPGIWFDCLEAPEQIDGHEVDEAAPDWVLRKALETPYRGCWWNPLDRIVADIRDPDMPWSDAQRFFFNWNRKGEGKAVDPKKWLSLTDATRVVPAGTRIGLGFDGSITEDATALIGCTADGFSWPIKIWERPEGNKQWRVPRLEVHEQMALAFEVYDVGLALCDPPKWWTEIEQWTQLYGGKDDRVQALDTNGQQLRFARAVDRWLTAIRGGDHTHSGDETVTRHVVAAHLKKQRSTADDEDQRTLYVLVKGQDGRKIDAAVGDVLAFEAAMSMPPAKPVVVPWAVWSDDE